jgi:hypothetical protein
MRLRAMPEKGRNKVKHTPGPWEAEFFGNWPRIFATTEDEQGITRRQIAEVFNFSPKERHANATLIALATELPHQCDDPDCHGGKLYQQHCQELIELAELRKAKAVFDSSAEPDTGGSTLRGSEA